MGFGNTIKGYFGAKRTEDPIKKYSGLGIRTNSIISIDLTPFYVNDEFMIMENPGTEHQVTHVGKLNMMGVDLYRFYLSSMTGEGESILQLQANSLTSDIIMFRQIDELHPQTIEDWNEWTGTDSVEGLLQTEHLAIQDGEVVFERMWGPSLVDSTEHVISDKPDEEPYDYPVKTMLYRRNIAEEGEDEFIEYLMVSIEDEERISMYVGFETSSAGLKIS